MTRAAILDALADSGHSVSAISGVLKESVDAGNYIREGACRPYAYRLAPDHAEPPAAPGPAGAYQGPAFGPPPTGASLGLVCDDELPPVVGARYGDAMHAICRRAVGALDG